MALPGVTPTIRDGALGTTTPGAGSVHLKLGPSPFGVVNSIYSVTDNTTLTAALGRGGALAEAAAVALAYPGVDAPPGNQIYCVPINPSTYGTASARHARRRRHGHDRGRGEAGQQFQIKIILGGAPPTSPPSSSRTTAALTYGATWTATAATMQVPGVPFVTLAFGGGTAVSGDIVTFATTGRADPDRHRHVDADRSVAAPAPTTRTRRSSPSPPPARWAWPSTPHARRRQHDAGPVPRPVSGTVVLADTGLVLTFAGTFTANDTYSFTTTGPTYTGSDFTNAMTAILADPRTWAFLHLLGQAASSAAAATLFATVDSQMSTGGERLPLRLLRLRVAAGHRREPDLEQRGARLGTHERLRRVHLHGEPAQRPRDEPLARLARRRARLQGRRVDRRRPRQGRQPLAGARRARLGRQGGEPRRVATPGLDAGALHDGDQHHRPRRLLHHAGPLHGDAPVRLLELGEPPRDGRRAPAGRNELLNLVNDTVFVNANGTINEGSAKQIETRVDRAEEAALVQQNPPLATSVGDGAAARRTSSRRRRCRSTIRVLPLGYTRYITEDIGFANPNLVQAGQAGRKESLTDATTWPTAAPAHQRQPLRLVERHRPDQRQEVRRVQSIDYEAMVEPGFVYGTDGSADRPHPRPAEDRQRDDRACSARSTRTCSSTSSRSPSASRGQLPHHREYSEAPNLARRHAADRHADRLPLQGLRPERQGQGNEAIVVRLPFTFMNCLANGVPLISAPANLIG
jgi:hypothetical protein